MTKQHFPIRAADRRVFDAIKDGTKSVETRAGSPRYENIKAGDSALFDCGGEHLTKKIGAVRRFTSVTAMLKKYEVKEIAPWCENKDELVKMYHRFYHGAIEKHGLIAMELQ